DPRLVRGMCHRRGGVFGRHPAGDGDGAALPEPGSDDLRHRCEREVRGLRAARRLLEGASQTSAGRSPQDLVRGGTHGLDRAQEHGEGAGGVEECHGGGVESSEVSMVTIARVGSVVLWSAAAVTVCGRSASEVAGKKLTTLGLPGMPGELLVEKTASVREGRR